jgi:2'-hydroxyisoflavone reductase
VLQACAEVCGVRPDWRWVDMATLQARGLQPWRDLPLALPDDAEHAGFMRVDGRRARGAGLHTRALHDTVADTLAWWEGLPAAQQGFDQAGLSPAQEARALDPT